MNFRLKEGVKLLYEFGQPEKITAQNLTDELAVKFLKKNPHYIKYFTHVPEWWEQYAQVNITMRVGVLIPTLRERPQFLAFLLNRLNRQTRKPDEVLILDYPNNTDKADIAKRYKEGAKKLLKTCDFVLFVEDDDYYPLTYIHEMCEAWAGSGKPKLIGCRETVYYHLQSRRWLKTAPRHSSAFCTGVGRGVNLNVCEDYEPYYDLALWKENKGIQVMIKKPPIGIKHGIGRCGGTGHDKDFRRYNKTDPYFQELKLMTDKEAFRFYCSLFPNKDVKVNILTRTHDRPAQFARMKKSVDEQTYKVNHIIGSDVDCGYTLHVKLELKPTEGNQPAGHYPAPYNRHMETLAKEVKEGWVMYLDDDYYLTDRYAIQRIVHEIDHEDQLLIWKTEINGRKVPKGNEIIKGDIDTHCFMFHSKHLPVEWGCWSMGDYKAVKNLSERLQVKWIDRVFTASQGKPKRGKSATVGVVIVNYNTPGIISEAVYSVHPYVNKVIIVDNSEKTNPAYKECDVLDKLRNVEVIHTRKNIGHGPALNRGIDHLTTDFIITMDSDALLTDPSVISEMMRELENEKVYGCGMNEPINEDGFMDYKGIPYLHPFFCMFTKRKFLQFSPFINHGAPFARTMKDIHGELTIKEIDLKDRVLHEGKKTRKIAGRGWTKNWDSCR